MLGQIYPGMTCDIILRNICIFARFAKVQLAAQHHSLHAANSWKYRGTFLIIDLTTNIYAATTNDMQQ